MLLPFCCLFSVGLVLQGSTQPPKSWIADVKAERAMLGRKEVRIEGDVVDIRSTSPVARAGFYRLIDASDPEGVLIRTDRLPRDGGALRVRAHLAAQQPEGGPMLLDEVEQQRLDQRPMAPLVLAIASLVTLLILTVLLIRAAIAERKYRDKTPLWLMPDPGHHGKALALPASAPKLTWSPELEEDDRLTRDRLRKRKRNLIQAMVGSVALAGFSTGWFFVTEPVSAQVPAFIFIEAEDTPIPVAQQRPDSSGAFAQALLDSLVVAFSRPAPQADPARQSGPVSQPANRSQPPPKAARPDTGTAAPPVSLPVFTPVPVPLPAPPPPPPPPPPPRDLEADRILVGQMITQSASRLVDGINSRNWESVARLLPERMAGDLARRERFMKLLRDYSPRATLGGMEGTTLAETQGEARFSVQLEWRGDFGVGVRKTGRFAGLASLNGSEWRFDGARLLTPLP